MMEESHLQDTPHDDDQVQALTRTNGDDQAHGPHHAWLLKVPVGVGADLRAAEPTRRDDPAGVAHVLGDLHLLDQRPPAGDE